MGPARHPDEVATGEKPAPGLKHNVLVGCRVGTGAVATGEKPAPGLKHLDAEEVEELDPSRQGRNPHRD